MLPIVAKHPFIFVRVLSMHCAFISYIRKLFSLAFDNILFRMETKGCRRRRFSVNFGMDIA